MTLFVAFFGEGKDYKDAYKAAKAIRTFSNRYAQLRRYSSSWGSVVVWDTRYDSMATYRENDLGDMLRRCADQDIIFVTKNKECIGTI